MIWVKIKVGTGFRRFSFLSFISFLFGYLISKTILFLIQFRGSCVIRISLFFDSNKILIALSNCQNDKSA